MLIYVTRKNGAFFQDYGRVIHDQAIYGVEAEGKLKTSLRYETFTFPDGEEYELCYPEYEITRRLTRRTTIWEDMCREVTSWHRAYKPPYAMTS